MNTSICHETAPAHAPEQPPAAAAQSSTLIEFPGAGRNRPQWRKELSERVREIQQRRALEAARDTEEDAPAAAAPTHAPRAKDARAGDERDPAAPPLGLVPPPEPQELNPIVAKALERIERARQQQQPQANGARHAQRGGAAAAATAARVNEENYRAPAETRAHETQAAPQALAETESAAAPEVSGVDVSQAAEAVKPAENVRTTNLVVVPTATIPVSETDALIKEALNRPRPRRHLSDVADEALLQRREAATAPQPNAPAEEVRETASLARRFAGGIVDLVVVAFASSPFAAVMELTSGNWHDPRVAGSLAGVVAVVMFVYLTASVALTGRTLGMALFGVRVTDERNGLIPTAGQCARRALFYMISLAALGLGLLPALFGRERRALHDRLSRTLVAPAK